MDGITATRLLRESERSGGLAPVPVIAMTGNSLSEDGATCVEAGMNAFLSKPFTLEELREVIARHVPGVPRAPHDAPL
jgi:CheY-like chemotaxis protein